MPHRGHRCLWVTPAGDFLSRRPPIRNLGRRPEGESGKLSKGECIEWTGGVYRMDADLPLLDHDRIARAAEGIIYNYGDGAMAEAARRAKTLRASGCDSAAATWESICKLIQLRVGGHTPSEPSAGQLGHSHVTWRGFLLAYPVRRIAAKR